MRTLIAMAALTACSDDPAKPHVPLDLDGTQTATADWDVDLFDPLFPSPTLERFDTLNGRRQLDAMVIEVDHTAQMTVDLENRSAYALTPDDYVFEFYLLSLIQLGVEDEPSEDDGPPFFGPGAFVASVSLDLEPGQTHQEVQTDTIRFEAPYDWEETPRYLEAMIGEEPIQLVVGGFSEAWVYWSDTIGDDALLHAGASAIQYTGTIVVTYEFSAAD